MNKIEVFLFFLAVVCSLISQTPEFIMNGSYQWLKYLWVFPCFFLCLKHYKQFFAPNNNLLFCILLSFMSYCLICQLMFNTIYISSDFNNIMMAVVICATSSVFWRYNRNDTINKILSCLLLAGGAFLANSVYSGFLVEADITGSYAYSPKNSLSSILLCCAIIPLLNFRPRNLYLKFPYYIAISYLIFVIFLLRSRAVLLGLFFIVSYLIIKSNNKKKRYAVIFIAVIIFLIIFTNEDIYNIIVVSILLSNSDASDIDSVSSGRVDIVSSGIQLFQDNCFFGIGEMYLENMPLAMLVQFGIFGAIIVFTLLYVIYRKLISCNFTISECKTAFLLFVAFLINSLFEAQAPFGPGAKSFLMWMTVGMAFSYEERKTKESKV